MNTPSPTPSHVVVVGSFNVDHVWRCDALPVAGATIAGRYANGPGGKGFNQAIAAVRAGADTTFVCALGDDAGGRLARDLAAADGLALRVQASDEPTGTAGIYVDAHGRNTIVIGAGNPAPWNTWKRTAPGDKPTNWPSLYTSGQAYVDPTTGELKGFFSHTPNDAWDFSGNNSVLLFDYKDPKTGKVVKASAKGLC